MTHKKIAELANVSVSTVSKALSGSKEVSAEITDEIKRIAIETGYFKEKNKRKLDSLKLKTALIAIVCPEITGVWYSTMITDIKKQVEALGGQIAIYIYDFETEKMVQILEMLMLRSGVDGIILMGSAPEGLTLTLPMVCFENTSASTWDSVSSDTKQIFLDIVAYLTSKGHSQIGFVGEINTMKKYEAFKEAMKVHGHTVNEEFVYITDSRFELAGYKAAAAMQASGKYPTAVVTAYDEIALGLIHMLNENGISVPDDISVVGCNNIPAAAYAQLPLTTVDMLWSEQCSVIVELLYDKIFHDNTQVYQIPLRHQLIERKSVSDIRT